MTVREIARLADISPATVSRFMTGAENVSPEVRERIQRILSEKGEVKKRKKKRNGIVGVLFSKLEGQFYNDIFRIMLEQKAQYPFELVFIPALPEKEEHAIKVLQNTRVDGLILMEETPGEKMLKFIEAKELPCAICGGVSSDIRCAMIHVNDMAAAYEGVRYLIRLGHERIAFIADYPHSISVGFQRMAGCRRAMEENGLEFSEALCRYGCPDYAVGYEKTRELAASGEEFTAIFAYSDDAAVGAINALKDSGIRVPEEVSVLGFDDNSAAVRCRPALTTIRQPLENMVKNTLDIFTFQNEDPRMQMNITLPHELIERDSCTIRRLR